MLTLSMLAVLCVVWHFVAAHVHSMFMVDQATAAAIQHAYETDGELAAIVELRRHFPGITDNENARRCVHMIAGWQPPASSSADTTCEH